jgi:hypothetical protein
MAHFLTGINVQLANPETGVVVQVVRVTHLFIVCYLLLAVRCQRNLIPWSNLLALVHFVALVFELSQELSCSILFPFLHVAMETDVQWGH